MRDPVIACFWEEFERFFDYTVKQVEVCPEELWSQKIAGDPLWQQFLHTFACIELFYALPDTAAVPILAGRSLEEVLLKRESGSPMSKAAMLDYATHMKELAKAYMDELNSARLTEPHPRMSAAMNKPRTHQHALMGMVRHACYHLGCCDTILRERGLDGVY